MHGINQKGLMPGEPHLFQKMGLVNYVCVLDGPGPDTRRAATHAWANWSGGYKLGKPRRPTSLVGLPKLFILDSAMPNLVASVALHALRERE